MKNTSTQMLYNRKFCEMKQLIADMSTKFKEKDCSVDLKIIQDPISKKLEKGIIMGSFPFSFSLTFVELYEFQLTIHSNSDDKNDIEVDLVDFCSIYPFFEELKYNDLVHNINIRYIYNSNEVHNQMFYYSTDSAKNNRINKFIHPLSDYIFDRQSKLGQLYMKEVNSIEKDVSSRILSQLKAHNRLEDINDSDLFNEICPPDKLDETKRMFNLVMNKLMETFDRDNMPSECKNCPTKNTCDSKHNCSESNNEENDSEE